ncbi:MAG: hypothetical protein RMJ56_16470 [Gemmataceae bacterium]|nr:hypothetical protein [Gemmata sp.]MDW8199192.1 hypothetical protein [Gemmataceae bacterium]
MSADVRAIDALSQWRAQLATYGELLAEALAGVNLEIRRVHEWLDEQLTLWKRAIRQCEEDVTRAKAELAQRQFPTWDGREPDCTVQEKNLRQAKARLEYAQDKVATIRRWMTRLPQVIDEVFTGPSRRLQSMLEADLPTALAELSRRIAALESYAGLRPDYAPLGTTATLINHRPPPPVTHTTASQDHNTRCSPSPAASPPEDSPREDNS